jgi:hypothetical protein
MALSGKEATMSQELRLFVASPGAVRAERGALVNVVSEVNHTLGDVRDYQVRLVQWESHVAPRAGRPQQVINEQIGDYDIFVGLMWRRFGTPTGVAGSGTEEEYRIAYRTGERRQRISLLFYFCQKPFMPAVKRHCGRREKSAGSRRGVVRVRLQKQHHESGPSGTAIIRDSSASYGSKNTDEGETPGPVAPL